MKRVTCYLIKAGNDGSFAGRAASRRDAVAALGDRRGMRVTVKHYAPRGTLSLTAYRRVKAGWRVVRARRLGGLRWQQGRKR